MAAVDGFAVMVEGVLKIDTVYENAALSKVHYLAYSTGDYDEEDFFLKPCGLCPDAEFEHYPNASVVPVSISIKGH